MSFDILYETFRPYVVKFALHIDLD